MLISKIQFVHTIKQIWAICEIMPRKTSALGQLYDILGVFGVVQGANDVMLKTLEPSAIGILMLSSVPRMRPAESGTSGSATGLSG